MHKDQVKKAFLISVLVTVILASFKLIVGYLSNSLALRYDALESLADLLIFASLYGATLLASKPPDSEHLYGHTKIEDLAALYTGMVIFLGGIYFAFEAFQKLNSRSVEVPGITAFFTSIFVVLLKEAMYFYTRQKARETSSPVLFALALDHHKDALSSIVTIAGTSAALFKYPFLDLIAALITAGIIIFIGVKTVFWASSDLLDKSPNKEVLENIFNTIASVEGIRKIANLKARKSGKDIYVDVDIEVDEDLSVKKAHEIATIARKKTLETIPNVKDVIVHVEPHQKA